jgi:dTDP-4-dehydrorhamnose 3,5-epimerase
MRVRPGELAGTLVFEPTPVRDERGFFTRTFDAEVAADAGLDPASLVQDSQSRSTYATVRGLHLRTDGGEGKLVRCAYGRVYDVAVDLRPLSPTFLKWQGVVLDDEDHRSVWLPRGLAHGFQVLSEVADICYRIDRPYAPGVEATVRWDDPVLGVVWPLPAGTMSVKDQAALPFAEVAAELDSWFGVVS